MTQKVVFLRMQGVMQAYGYSSQVIVPSLECPSKSAVYGMILCAMGVERCNSSPVLARMRDLRMGVRIDNPGTRMWDYQTVGGGGIGNRNAEGKIKKETLIKHHEYLVDASYMVAIMGDSVLIDEIYQAMLYPHWPIYLGKRSCPPCSCVLAVPQTDAWSNPMPCDDLTKALTLPELIAYTHGPVDYTCNCIVDCGFGESTETWYDVPVDYNCWSNRLPRAVKRIKVKVNGGSVIKQDDYQITPRRQRIDYNNEQYRQARLEKLEKHDGTCAYCHGRATEMHHINYRRPGNEKQEDLCPLCSLCHKAVTMLAYSVTLGVDNIDPCDPKWHNDIDINRQAILSHKSRKGR